MAKPPQNVRALRNSTKPQLMRLQSLIRNLKNKAVGKPIEGDVSHINLIKPPKQVKPKSKELSKEDVQKLVQISKDLVDLTSSIDDINTILKGARKKHG